MPSSPVNVTSVNVHSISRTSPFHGAENPTIGWRLAVACKRLRFPVQRTFCHCERSVAISRKGHRIIKPTQDTFVLAWRKKAHTSIRVSIVAPDNAISKVQCAPRIILNRFLLMPTDNNNFPLSLLYLLKTMLYRVVLCIAARFVFFEFLQKAAQLFDVGVVKFNKFAGKRRVFFTI